jgi:hypothetical protein
MLMVVARPRLAVPSSYNMFQLTEAASGALGGSSGKSEERQCMLWCMLWTRGTVRLLCHPDACSNCNPLI